MQVLALLHVEPGEGLLARLGPELDQLAVLLFEVLVVDLLLDEAVLREQGSLDRLASELDVVRLQHPFKLSGHAFPRAVAGRVCLPGG